MKVSYFQEGVDCERFCDKGDESFGCDGLPVEVRNERRTEYRANSGVYLFGFLSWRSVSTPFILGMTMSRMTRPISS